MRFCPFCSAENADELAVCQACGRRLPPLPPRRARNAPGTGVLLPPRAQSTTSPPPVTAPRRAGTTNPPPNPNAAQPGVMVTSAGLVPVSRPPASPTNPALGAAIPGAANPPPGSATQTAPGFPPPPALPADDAARGLANALSPGPAAQRRDPSPADPAGSSDAGLGRRRSDPPPTQPRVMPSILRSAPGSSSSPGISLPPRAPSSIPPATNPALIAAPSAPPIGGSHAADPPWANSQSRMPAAPAAPAEPVAIETVRPRSDDGVEPPPTRIHRPEALVDRPFTPPQVSPVPEIPEPGLVNSARYAVRFARARWQRRGAIKTLGGDIKKDTDALDQVLGALGGVARTAKVDGRVFSGENAAITSAEMRGEQIKREHNDVDVRKLDENSKFVDIERERNAKLGEAERTVDEVQKELAQLETQRRGLRDKRKELERRQKAYLKAAGDNDRQTGGAEAGDARSEMRRAAEQNRKEAAALEPERQDIDRKLTALERPISEATAKLDAAKAELDAAKRSLSDAREGHTHRLAELDAEQKRKAREIAQAEAEILRRLVTLGTLVNLNRIEDPQFDELYQRIDRLRGAITARTTEIEKLTAEREAFDRGNLVRGIATLGGAVIVFIALIVILRAMIR
jgi:hypothetical protein